MSGRLIALDKLPGVRPVGVGETWHRLFLNVYLRSRYLRPLTRAGMNRSAVGLRQENTGRYTGFNIFGNLIKLMKNGF